MKRTLVLAVLAALAFAAPMLAQGPPLPDPTGFGEFATPEGMQPPPPGGPCGAVHEGMRPSRHGGPGGPTGPAMRPPGPPPEVALKDALGLSDEQVAGLKALLDARRQSAEALMSRLRDAEKALADGLKAANPDPTQLGTLLIQIHGVHTKLEQGPETLRTGFRKLLTTAQQQKVDQINAPRTSLQAAEALQRLGM
jgi:hypothetical protein